jgi:hypothetical protein
MLGFVGDDGSQVWKPTMQQNAGMFGEGSVPGIPEGGSLPQTSASGPQSLMLGTYVDPDGQLTVWHEVCVCEQRCEPRSQQTPLSGPELQQTSSTGHVVEPQGLTQAPSWQLAGNWQFCTLHVAVGRGVGVAVSVGRGVAVGLGVGVAVGVGRGVAVGVGLGVGTTSLNAGKQSSATAFATSTAGPKFVLFTDTVVAGNLTPLGSFAR